MEGHMEGQHLT